MKPKKFIFGEELWNNGVRKDCFFSQGCLKTVHPNETNVSKQAIYISQSLDSREKETRWSRFKMKLSLNHENIVDVYFFSSDTKEVEVDGIKINLDLFLQDFTYSVEEKNKFLRSVWSEKYKNKIEMPLHKLKGRYLWFQIEMISFEKTDLSIDRLEIEFPLESIDRYLPSIYRFEMNNQAFLTRFLGMYQSLIYDLQYEIENIARNFDIDFVSGAYLKWLSKWTCAELPFYWEEESWKVFIKNSFRFYQKKGTKQCLEEVINLFLGHEVYIMENFTILDFYKKKEYDEQVKHLYSEDIYRFFIFVEQEWIESSEKMEQLEQLIEIFQPVQTKASLIVLQQSFILGQHTYLGLNSRIANNETLVLTDYRSIPFDSTIID